MSQNPVVLEIRNVKGLHARAAAKFVETVEKFDASAVVSFDGMVVSGDSIMGLMMLGAAKGKAIEVSTSGPEADPLQMALKDLIEDCFGEGR